MSVIFVMGFEYVVDGDEHLAGDRDELSMRISCECARQARHTDKESDGPTC